MKKLIKYLKTNGYKPTPWAHANNISDAVMSRLMNGGNISPKNALKISKATDYEVSVTDLLYPDFKIAS